MHVVKKGQCNKNSKNTGATNPLNNDQSITVRVTETLYAHMGSTEQIQIHSIFFNTRLFRAVGNLLKLIGEC